MRFFCCLIAFLGIVGCDKSSNFCKDALASSYSESFKVWCPTQQSDYFIPVKYGCPPHGGGISPPISWSGIPEGTTHLFVQIVDATCTYECDDCCKYHHLRLKFPLKDLPETGPITIHGLAEDAIKDPMVQKYMLANSSDKIAYMPLCPPAIQIHAYIYQVIAYDASGKVLGRSQSTPLLYSFGIR